MVSTPFYSLNSTTLRTGGKPQKMSKCSVSFGHSPFLQQHGVNERLPSIETNMEQALLVGDAELLLAHTY